jgi:NADPH:quinone reductase-like Zn-dependent oxidoreductase
MSSSALKGGPAHAVPDRVVAAIIDKPGAPPRLGEVGLPALTPGDSVLRVLAAPLNPLDLLIASGTFHSAHYEQPYVPGSECVGVVVQSQRHAPGTRVYAQCQAGPDRPGSLATHLVVHDDETIPLPDALDAIAAAAVGNSGVAAYVPLIETAGLQAGETVLILGATGAVGQLAVQIARSHGAAKVVGVGRNRLALDRLLRLGADAVVALQPDESENELAARLRDAAGPVDVLLDGLFGVPLQAALKSCASHGRVVNIGNPCGPSAVLSAGLLRSRQLTLSGFAGLHMSMNAKQGALGWLWRQVIDAALTIDVRSSALQDISATWLVQQSSPHAKCVVIPS